MRNGILALVTLALTTAAAPAQGWAEKMFMGTLTHDFGTVARGAQLSHRFTITNIYAVRMEITDIKSGCGCVSASAAKRVLEPRETTTVELRMDARRFVGPKTVGVRVSVLGIADPVYGSSAELKVTANSRSDIVFNPGEISFGNVTRGMAPTQVIDVEYAGVVPWQVTEVIAKDVPCTVTMAELYRRPGQVGYRLKVTLKEDAPVGLLKHHLYLKTNDPGSPLVTVLLEANVQSAVTVSPPSLNLGVVKSDTALTRCVVVRGNKPFHVLEVAGTGNGIDLGTPPSPTDAPVQTLTFKCQFTKDGEFRRELKIKTTLQDDPVVITIDGTAAK